MSVPTVKPRRQKEILYDQQCGLCAISRYRLDKFVIFKATIEEIFAAKRGR